MTLNDLYVLIWVAQSTIAVLAITFNVVRAKRKIIAVRRDTTRPASRRAALLELAYKKLMRQATFLIAMTFNAAAGWLVYLIEPNATRAGLTVILLIAADFVLTLLALLDAGYDD